MDPTAVRSLVVTTADVVSAAEARRNGRPVVLRATPPFHGRMRARLHVATPERSDPPDGVAGWAVFDSAARRTAGDAIHLDPWGLFDADVPVYPTPAATEDRLRASDRAFSTETHHDYHTSAVAAWRRAVVRHRRDAVTVRTNDDTHEVRVRWLD